MMIGFQLVTMCRCLLVSKINNPLRRDRFFAASRLQTGREPGVRQIMSEQSEPLYVDCGEHGQRISAVVCRHLVKASGQRVGFIENSSDPNDLQAWCHKCEMLFC